MGATIEEIEAAHLRLFSAVMRERSDRYCMRLWSEFIRIRDGRRCVACHSPKRLSAHHVVRKSFFPQARLQRGNGITLCATCHREPHEAFNRRPDMKQPMDSQGGDDNDLITHHFGLLLTDATERGLLREDFYFLHDRVLETFKKLQGLEPDLAFPGTPLEQAYLIWRQTPRNVMNALMVANGCAPLPEGYIQLPGITIVDPSRRNG